MYIRGIFFPLIFLFFIVIACDNEEETHLNISGQVTNAATGTGLSGATVSLKNKGFFTAKVLVKTTTDDKGYYYISYTEKGYCPQSILMLRAERYGFKSITDSDSGSTRLLCIDAPQTINFPLKLQK